LRIRAIVGEAVVEGGPYRGNGARAARLFAFSPSTPLSGGSVTGGLGFSPVGTGTFSFGPATTVEPRAVIATTPEITLTTVVFALTEIAKTGSLILSLIRFAFAFLTSK
jgi:hypothetical protein